MWDRAYEWLPGWVAVLISVIAGIGALLGWLSNRRRIRRVENAGAGDLEIVPLEGISFEGYPVYGVWNKGNAEIGYVKIEPDSFTGVGIGGATTFLTIGRGETAEHFWFRTHDRMSIPASLRFTWKRPARAEQYVRVPRGASE